MKLQYSGHKVTYFQVKVCQKKFNFKISYIVENNIF